MSRSPVSPPRACVLISGRGRGWVGIAVAGLGLVVVGELISHHHQRQGRHRCLRVECRPGLSPQYPGLAVARLAYPVVSSFATAVDTTEFGRKGRTRSIGSRASVRYPSSRHHDLVSLSQASLSDTVPMGAL